MADPHVAVAEPSDLAVIRRIWPLLLAAFLTSVPMTAASIFMPAIAVDLAVSVAVIGGLRGVGGLAALASGVLGAPLIDRLPRAWTITGGLTVFAVAALLAAQASLPMLVVFYLLAGAAGSIVQPALQSASADNVTPAIGARAAALMSALGALSAIVAAPLLALPAEIWGWRGDFIAIATGIVLMVIIAGLMLDRQPPRGVVRTGYLAAFRLMGAAPGAVALLLASLLRSTVWMGWVAYLPAYFAEQFAAPSIVVALVWSLGGGAFFVTNLVTGRLIATGVAGTWRTPERLLLGSLAASIVLAPVSLLMPSLPLALLGTTVFAGVHGVALASLISLLVRRYTNMRGAVMGLNTAGFNIGIFLGATIGGVGLAFGGYPGLALVLGLLAVLPLVITLMAIRQTALPTAAPG